VQYAQQQTQAPQYAQAQPVPQGNPYGDDIPF